MQRYEKLTAEETFQQKYSTYFRQSIKVGCSFDKEDWVLFQQSHYLACLKTQMSPVGIFMYKDECSKYTFEHFVKNLLVLKSRIPKIVKFPGDTQKWLNEFHCWDEEDTGWNFFACCSGAKPGARD